MGQRPLHVLDSFQVLSIGKVRWLQMHTVLRLCHLQCFLPLTASLVKLVQHVKATTLLQELLSIFNHIQVYGDGCKTSLRLRFDASPESSSCTGMAHLPKAFLGNVKSAGLHTHLRHAFPNTCRSHALDALVRLVCVATGQVVREVQQGCSCVLVHVLQTRKVPKHCLCDHGPGVLLLWSSFRRAHLPDLPGKVDVRHHQCHGHTWQARTIRIHTAHSVLEQNLISISHEECDDTVLRALVLRSVDALSQG
mmetsp:Transcript_38909/g.70172  ORF Transcript_38909/g.70172 Transcript_38909/m.70172 type:complete len:251 (-) Transcript_38909:1979-2731(-)